MKSLLVLFAFVALFAQPTYAQDGGSGGVGNGGSDFEIMFWREAQKISNVMQTQAFCDEIADFDIVNDAWSDQPYRSCATPLYRLMIKALSNHSKIRVVLVNHALYEQIDGRKIRRVALNYPAKKLIEFDSSQINRLAADRMKMREILYHEFIGVLGSNLDKTYALSSRFGDFQRRYRRY